MISPIEAGNLIIRMTKIIVNILLLSAIAVTNAVAGSYAFDADRNVRFAWELNDEVGTYTVSGTRIFGYVAQVDANPRHALLALRGWSTKENTQYYAYAPYDTRYVSEGRDITALPISYLGQKQAVNDDAAHLSAYDFMMATYTTGITTADISLRHVGCIVRMEWLPERGGCFTSVTLSAEEPLFPVEAVMNLPKDTVAMTKWANSITLSLDSIVTQDGEPLTAWLFLPPMDITDKVITATLCSGDSVACEDEMMGTLLLAGCSYPVSLGKEYTGDRNLAAPADDVAPSVVSSLTTPMVTTTDFAYDMEHPLTHKSLVDEPDEPDNPDNPDEPKDPDNPDNPDEPKDPDNPDNPDEPKDPDNPDNPDNPDEPKDPEDPTPPIDTAIDGVAHSKDDSRAKVFTIYGARVTGTQRRGLYIINGKKYFTDNRTYLSQ